MRYCFTVNLEPVPATTTQVGTTWAITQRWSHHTFYVPQKNPCISAIHYLLSVGCRESNQHPTKTLTKNRVGRWAASVLGSVAKVRGGARDPPEKNPLS